MTGELKPEVHQNAAVIWRLQDFFFSLTLMKLTENITMLNV